MKQAIYKVPEGKLIKLFLDSQDNIIKNIKITGDFFIHPEEKITSLENALKGQVLDEKKLTELLEETIQKEKMELFGVDAESIAKTIMLAANK